jgi:hypothetical protein
MSWEKIMQRKFHWPVLAIFLLFALAGCGGGGDSATDTTLAEVGSRVSVQDADSAQAPSSTAIVTALNKVSETRISRTVFEYTFRVSIRNGSTPGAPLTAVARSAANATKVIQGIARFGDVPAGANAVSTNTITIRHDRTFAFDPRVLAWIITTNASGAAVPTNVTTRVGGINMVEKLVVLDVKENVPGKLDYKLAPIFCNHQQTSASQRVTLKYLDPSATVLNSGTQVGASHYGQCRFITRSPLEIRTNKVSGFDATKVSIEIEEAKQLITNPIRLVKVDLFRLGGQVGHEELLPLNTIYPQAGQTVNLKAIIDGRQVIASYRVLSPDGTVLLAAKDFSALATPENNGVFVSEFIVPPTPFRLEILAKDNQSNDLTWTTELYEPQLTLLKIYFEDAVFTAPSSSRSGVISGTAARSGTLAVKLHLPTDLQSDWTQKTISVTKGQVIDLPFTLTVPNQLQIGKHRVFAQYKYDQDVDVLIMTPILIVNPLN